MTTPLPLGHFAAVLDYPGPSLAAEVEACLEALRAAHPSAARELEAFADCLRRDGLTAMEEAYTGAFDLGAECAPYLGHHLLGEGWRRTAFLLRLRACFRESGFTESTELPDHLCTVLRFLADHAESAEGPDLVQCCLVPVLVKLGKVLEARDSPYRRPVAALLEALGGAAVDQAHEITAGGSPSGTPAGGEFAGRSEALP